MPAGKIRYSLTLWMTFLSLSVFPQAFPGFTGSVEDFPAELQSFMGMNENETAVNSMTSFLSEWPGTFTPEEQQQVTAISVLLYEKNARPYPHFSNFLTTILTMRHSGNAKGNYTEWIKGLLYLIRNSTLQTANSYLEFTASFISDGILYSSASVRWKSLSASYAFISDPVPGVRIDKTDLVCFSNNDSIIISGTGGTFFQADAMWEGLSGTVTWERAGFSKEDVFAKLSAYRINMTRPQYEADSVIFTNKNYFHESIAGTLNDRVMRNRTPAEADYPQFNTYQKDFEIRDLYQDISYKGGLAMQGAKLIGRGDRFNPAEVSIFRKDTLQVTARSVYFAFKAARIDAPNAEISIKLKQDSIYHPGISFAYVLQNRELTLYSSDNFTSQSPYFSSYHNIDMTFGQLVWRMEEPYMHFTGLTGSTKGDATFESVSYFNSERYERMQGMDEVHPLISIRSFGRMVQSDIINAEDFANYLRKPLSQVKQMLMRMAVLGFIYYDTESGIATIKQRLNDYLAASVDKIDYDAISFPSTAVMPEENAVLDLRTYDLTINGIPRIILSENRNVAIYPEGASVVLKKNRDMSFNGLVEAGLLLFMGKNFFFSYDTFKLSLNKIDSMRISYLNGEKDNMGFDRTETVKNLMRDLSGVLYIDEPDNKSGKESFAQYPVFSASQAGFVYYNDIREGVYTSDRFYFRLDPFTMDSLRTFNYKSLNFSGELYSADIFPVTDEILSLNRDNSLGFTAHATPDTGLSVYKGNGVFYNLISLDSRGLTGSGRLDYLASSSLSDDIVFYPDSAVFEAKDFSVAETTTGAGFPAVSSSGNMLRWLPYDDELYVYKSEEPFNMFNGQANLDGDLVMKPSGLTGKGKVNMEGAELDAGVYRFGTEELFADTADFYLKSLHTEGYTVLAGNMKAHVDFNTQTGTFTSNDDFTLVAFPENKYISYLDNFTWQKDKKLLAMGTATEMQDSGEVFSGARYISLDPDQDSLSFISPVAYYDYDNNLIKASGVKYIDIADARIYPDMEELVVKEDGKLAQLENSGIVAGRENKNYNLFNAVININSRNSYTGSADYEYADETGQSQVLHFRELAVNSELISTGSGDVIEEDHFTLSPSFKYQGRFFMEADKPLLTFDGGASIINNCDNISPGWLYFRSEINPDEVRIPVDGQSRDIDRNPLFSGLYMYYDSVHIYPAFLSPKKFHSDRAVITSSGFLSYNPEKQEYMIASNEKLADDPAAGNLVTLNNETCEIYGEGKIETGEDLGQVKLQSYGTVLHNPAAGTTEMNVMLGMDFFVSQDIAGLMAGELDSVPSLEPTDLTSDAYRKNVTGILGQEGYERYMSQLTLFGSAKEIPQGIRHTITFSELKLVWDDEMNSWKSSGKIGVASIDNTPVNKRMNGLFELQIKRSGDICDIYLEADRRTWMYLGYTRGVMQIHSSSTKLLDRIKNQKNRDRRMKIRNGESYIYMVSTDAKKNTFYRRYLDETESQNPANSQ